MERLDVPRLPSVVPERLAKLPNAGREGAVAHEGVRPHRAEHLVFRDDVARSLEQEAQQGESLWRELHLLPAAAEPTPGVQPVGTERNRLIPQHFPWATSQEPSRGKPQKLLTTSGPSARMVLAQTATRGKPAARWIAASGVRKKNGDPTKRRRRGRSVVGPGLVGSSSSGCSARLERTGGPADRRTRRGKQGASARPGRSRDR